MHLKVRDSNTGTLIEIPYKPTTPAKQSEAISRWLIDEQKYRPSEAAMQVSSYKEKKLRKMYQDLIIAGKIVQ